MEGRRVATLEVVEAVAEGRREAAVVVERAVAQAHMHDRGWAQLYRTFNAPVSGRDVFGATP